MSDVDIWRFAHQQRSPQVDARLYGDVVRSLQEGPLQDQSQEEEHGQDRSVLQQLGGRHEVHAEIRLLQQRTQHSTLFFKFFYLKTTTNVENLMEDKDKILNLSFFTSILH